jgi:glycosyltransferase involved in cell wall biosynthesis
MPSLKEGFGIVYLEAWRHGMPVLAGDRDAGREVVEHGVDGVVVDPTSEHAIADGIVRLLSDRDAAARMGEAGRRKLHREYSHQRFAARFEEALAALA